MGNSVFPQQPSYANVNVNSPYASAAIGKDGAIYVLNPFLTQQNKMIESKVPELYQNLFNPSLDNPIAQARTQAFQKAFNTQSKKAFENNLINPLVQRRMLRSSLLNDLSNNYQKTQASQIADFNTNLLSNTISDTQSLINMLMNQYAANSNYGNALMALAQNNSSAVNSYNSNAYSQQLQNMWKSMNLANTASGTLTTALLAALI